MYGGNKAWITLLERKKMEIEQPDECLGGDVRAPSLDWGNKYESHAIAHYELMYNVDVVVPKESIVNPYLDYVAVLPDFINGSVVGEVKCPYNEEIHAMTVVHGTGTEDYKPQIQSEIWCTQKDGLHFLSYDPRYPDPFKRLVIIPVERDQKFIDEMAEKCEKFWNYLMTDTRPEDIGGMDEIPEFF
jgi:hypothetical protein